MAIIPVILCGGSGSRLWPLSRALYPKPFLRMPNGASLFRNTLDRLAALKNAAAPLVVTNEAHSLPAIICLCASRPRSIAPAAPPAAAGSGA